LPTSPQPNVLSAGTPFGFSPWFWVLVVLTGIGAGIGGGLLMALLRAVQHLSWSYSTGTFLDAVEETGWQQRMAVLVAAGILVGAVRWVWKQRPGGHAGELSEAIWFHCGRLPFAATLGRAVLSIVIVGMGASLGREAAPKQTGAAIANALAERARLSSLERRLLVACGTGAGMAAVYNVPFGGALFALEVLLGSLALPLIAPALATSLVATWVSWLLLPDVAEYTVLRYEVSTTQIVWALVFGPLTGLAAVVYVRLIAWADSHSPHRWALFVAPVLVFAALGLLALQFPQLLGNGKDVVQQLLLDQLALPLLIPLLLLKPLVTSACLGSGAPGGLFTPTLTCGALLGGLCGRLWDFAWPGASPGSHALIGAGAFLAAAMQGPICAIVLVLELTRFADAVLVPLMLAVAGAVAVAYRLEGRSIYSARIHSGRKAAHVDKAPPGTRFDRLVSKDYAVISAAASHDEVASQFLAAAGRYRPLYVVDEHGELIGVIAGPPAPTALPQAPRAIMTAADLAQPVAPLRASMSEQDAMDHLEKAGAAELPVLEETTGRLIGVARLAPTRESG
jgi:chloride channel protein, CIC family